MQLQGSIDQKHNFQGKVPYLLDQTEFVDRSSLVDHDLRMCRQAAGPRRDIHFKGIDSIDLGGYRRNGNNGGMGIVDVVGNDHRRPGFFGFGPKGGIKIDQEHLSPLNRGRHRWPLPVRDLFV